VTDDAPEYPAHLPEDVGQVWLEYRNAGLFYHLLMSPEFEAYAGQVVRLRDAQQRIAEEGMVVLDARGNPEPHPAIAIERAAQVEIRLWGDRFRPRLSY